MDKFSLGEFVLWDIVVTNKSFTFYEFINDLYNEGYNKNNLGILIGEFQVISNYMTIYNNTSIYQSPSISWSAYMGSNYLYFNQFDLYFESSCGSLIQKISNVNTSDAACHYALSSSLWQSICNSSGSSFKIYFVARQTQFYVSGNYYSRSFTFDKPAHI